MPARPQQVPGPGIEHATVSTPGVLFETDMSKAILRDITALAEEIGPRGSGTEGEERAADYVAERFMELGYAPQAQEFTAPRSAWAPFAISAALVFGATCAFIAVPGPLVSCGSAVIAAMGIVLAILELQHRGNPLRWLLPKATSRNILAVAPAREHTERRVIIISHLDTHRTPLVHSTTGWLKLFRRLIPLGIGAAVAFVLIAASACVLGPEPQNAWVHRLAAAATALVTGAILLLCIQADTTAYSPGANDNASGVGVLLSLAERLKDAPLWRTEVILAATGCQEVGNYGATALLQALRDETDHAVCLVIDKVGCTGPYYLTDERRWRVYRYDPDLIAQAQAVAADHPQLALRPGSYRNAYTEGLAGIHAGLPTLVLLGLDLTGWVPHLHQADDVVDQINPDVLERTETFAWHWLLWHDVRQEWSDS